MTVPIGDDGPPRGADPGLPGPGDRRARDAHPFIDHHDQDHHHHHRHDDDDAEEFEDEPPGAYLEEGRLGGSAVAWGGFLALAVVAVAGLGWWISNLDPGDSVEPVEPETRPFDPAVLRFPLGVAWTVLPVLAGFSFLVTVFIRLNQGSPGPREARLGSMAVNLQLAAVLLWFAARFLLGIDFAGP